MTKKLLRYFSSMIFLLVMIGSCSSCPKGSPLVPGEHVTVRQLDKPLLLQKIREGKGYLLRILNREFYGFPKKYDAYNDRLERRLRTIYTASSLWTLLKINDLEKDPEIEALIPRIAGFLLSMQVTDGENAGAFHYAFDPTTGEKEKRFVVGTASKTIFTLLELYQRIGDAAYLDAAKRAGDWLLKMRNPDGSVVAYIKWVDGKPIYERKLSCLYTGQVLSALSRLYRVTADDRYLAAAAVLAERTKQKAVSENYFVHDDFRLPQDPVPTSWVIMSLLDYTIATQDEESWLVLTKALDGLLTRQYIQRADLLNYGRFEGTTASSGNGWILEVMSEVHPLCRARGKEDCGKYLEAAVPLMRWLIQNTYSQDNSSHLKNPARAQGGLIRNNREESVRTDAVCHGINGYINFFLIL